MTTVYLSGAAFYLPSPGRPVAAGRPTPAARSAASAAGGDHRQPRSGTWGAP